MNKHSKSVSVKVFSDPDNLSFIVQIDKRLFSYDYNNFHEIKIDALQILAYSDSVLIYLDSEGKIKVKSV